MNVPLFDVQSYPFSETSTRTTLLSPCMRGATQEMAEEFFQTASDFSSPNLREIRRSANRAKFKKGLVDLLANDLVCVNEIFAEYGNDCTTIGISPSRRKLKDSRFL